MKREIIYFLILASLFESGTQVMNGQGIDISAGKGKRLFVGLSFSPAKPAISSTAGELNYSPDIIQNKSIIAGAEMGYFFSKNIAISLGAGMNSYQFQLSLDSYSAKQTKTDSDQDTYERRISGQNISETEKIGFLSFPVAFILRLPVSDRIGFEIAPGLNFSIPINKAYSNKGTFSYTGYYPKYNLLISNVPYESFTSAAENSSSGDLELKSFVPEINASARLYIKLMDNLQLNAGFLFCKMLSNISGYNAATDFILSSQPDELNSLMNFNSEVSTQSTGINIGIRYYIK